jgi:hypothetical protein
MPDEKWTKIDKSSESAGGKKMSATKLSAYITIIIGVLTIITLVLEIPGKIANVTGCNSKQTTRFSGVVRAEGTGHPVSGAIIRVKRSENSNGVLGSGHTNAQGRFGFDIEAGDNDPVWVMVMKNQDIGFRGMKVQKQNVSIIFENHP